MKKRVSPGGRPSAESGSGIFKISFHLLHAFLIAEDLGNIKGDELSSESDGLMASL